MGKKRTLFLVFIFLNFFLSFNVFATVDIFHKSLGDDVLFSCNFNNELNAILSGDTVAGAKSGDIEFVSGVFENGAIFDASTLVFEGFEADISKCGTIEFWVKPQWDGADFRKESHSHHFLSIYTSDSNYLYFKIDGFGRPTVYYHSEGLKQKFDGFASAKDWAADKWHHILFTWDFNNAANMQAEFYIDGKLFVSKYKLKESGELFQTDENTKLILGGWVDNSRLADCVLDEVRISSKSYRPEVQIANQFARYYASFNANVLKERIVAAEAGLKKYYDLIDSTLRPGKAELLVKQAKYGIRCVERNIINKIETVKQETVDRYMDWSAAIAEDIETVLAEAKVAERFESNDNLFESVLADSLQKPKKDKWEFDSDVAKELTLNTAKNEYESFQIMVFPFGNSLKNVSVEFLADGGLDVSIEADTLEIYKVGYVDIYDEAGYKELVADPLEKIDGVVNLDYREVLSYWVTFKVDAKTKADSYKLKFAVKGEDFAGNSFVQTLEPEVVVHDVTVPTKATLKSTFGLTPTYLRRQHGIIDDDQARSVTDKYTKFLLNHKMTLKGFIRSNDEVVWQDDVYYLQPKYILTANKDVRIEWDDFDKQIEKYIPYGLNTIQAGTRNWVKPESGSKWIYVYDEAAKRDRWHHVKMLSPEYKLMLKQIFTQWQDHLSEKGWLDMAYSYAIDEPSKNLQKSIDEVHRLINESAPGIKRMVTTERPTDIISDIDIWTGFTHNISVDEVVKEQNKGRHMWYYTATGPLPPDAGFMIKDSAISARIGFWHTYYWGGEGYLYWEVACWGCRSPWKDTGWWETSRPFEGNGTLLYNGFDGPLPSIRLENIRDGIEDFELMSMAEPSANIKTRHEFLSKMGFSDKFWSPTDWPRKSTVLLKLKKELLEYVENN